MLVEYVCDDHVVTLTLNRPEKLNAFSDELVVALNDALRRFDADPEAYVGIVLESDLIVTEAGTKFQITETPRGLGAAKYWGLMHFRGAGAFGTEVALTGRFFTAEEALAAGLINRVATAGTHMDAARELARAVCQNPPLSVRATVRSRRWYLDQLGREIMMQTAPLKLYLTEDFQEAARAFAEKRKPGP